MTVNPVERERISREVARKYGYEAWPSDSWTRLVEDASKNCGLSREQLPDDIRDALIDDRCRVVELEEALAAAIQLCGG